MYHLRRDCVRASIPRHWSPLAQAWARVGSQACSLGHDAVLLKATREFTQFADEGPRAVVANHLLQCSSDWAQYDDDACLMEPQYDEELRDWCRAHDFLLCGACKAAVKIDRTQLPAKPPRADRVTAAYHERAELLYLFERGHRHGIQLPSERVSQPRPDVRAAPQQQQPQQQVRHPHQQQRQQREQQQQNADESKRGGGQQRKTVKAKRRSAAAEWSAEVDKPRNHRGSEQSSAPVAELADAFDGPTASFDLSSSDDSRVAAAATESSSELETSAQSADNDSADNADNANKDDSGQTESSATSAAETQNTGKGDAKAGEEAPAVAPARVKQCANCGATRAAAAGKTKLLKCSGCMK